MNGDGTLRNIMTFAAASILAAGVIGLWSAVGANDDSIGDVEKKQAAIEADVNNIKEDVREIKDDVKFIREALTSERRHPHPRGSSSANSENSE